MCYAVLAIVGVCVNKIRQMLLLSSRDSIEADLEEEAQPTLELLMMCIRNSIETAVDEEAKVSLYILLNSIRDSMRRDLAEEAQTLKLLLPSISNPTEMVVSHIWPCMLLC
jgi:hypothetical protein